jgi:adenylate cyclase
MFAVAGVFILGLGAVVYMATQLQIQESESFVSWSIQRNLESRGERLKMTFQRLVDKGELSLRLQSIDKSSQILGIQVLKWPTLELQEERMLESLPSSDKFSPEFSQEHMASFREDEGNFVLQKRSATVQQLSKRVGEEYIISLFFLTENLQDLMSSQGLEELALFNSSGEVFLQSGNSKLANSATAGSSGQLPQEIFSRLSFSADTSEQFPFHDSRDRKFIGSVYKTGISGTVLGAWIPYEVVLETPKKVARRSFYLGLGVLGIALLVSMLFSNSLIKPIYALVSATRHIASGDFATRIKIETNDELSLLGDSFNNMAEGLEERQKLKDLFGKFHSEAVVKKLMADDKIRLGGERLPVTVFFSDIRSFTSTSEKMTPEEVVEMLNEYMTEMVGVIEEEGGVVDKYVGDAIMAVWGLAKEDPEASALHATRACLKMRDRLALLNQRRVGRGQSEIKMGMGLTSGEVIAGNIGSQSRMEYTVIGDTVNTASRMESLTKDNETDFLIHFSTAEFVKNHVQLEGPIAVHAKGKADEIQVYKVTALATRAAN